MRHVFGFPGADQFITGHLTGRQAPEIVEQNHGAEDGKHRAAGVEKAIDVSIAALVVPQLILTCSSEPLNTNQQISSISTWPIARQTFLPRTESRETSGRCPSGCAHVFEGAHGLFHGFSNTPHGDFPAMLKDFGGTWLWPTIAFKPYACGIMAHPYIDCARCAARE